MTMRQTSRLLGAGLALSLMLAGCEPAPDADDTDHQVVERSTTEERYVGDQTRPGQTETSVATDDQVAKSDPGVASRSEVSKRSTGVASDEQPSATEKDVLVKHSKDTDKTSAIDKTSSERSDVEADQDEPDKAAPDIVKLTLMETDLSTFHQLLNLADLEDTLNEGRYTVLAPNNQAFAKLPKGQLDALRKNKQKLRQVLMYHLIRQPVSSTDLGRQKSALTLFEGRKLSVVPGTPATSGKPVIQDAKLVRPDIWTSNGLVHIIDKVLLPADILNS